MKNFEMANSDDPEGVILATQRSFVTLLKEVVAHTKKECGGPGMTWAQIEYLIDELGKKKPTVIHQEGEM